jgi:phosphatidylserine decarboxylase
MLTLASPQFRTRVEQFRQARRIHGGTLNLCLAAAGVQLAQLPIPSRRLRRLLYRTIYGKKYKALDESELERPLDSYPSLNALFTRGVRPEARPIAAAAGQFACPCDGQIQEVGRFAQDRLVTVKGVEYRLGELVPSFDTSRFQDGLYSIVFLSPVDCHRIFSPQEGRLEELVHVPGYRLLVHPPYQRNEYPVFALNERVVFRLATPLGVCLLIMVAGWGVGHVTVPIDPAFRPRPGKRRALRKVYPQPLPVRKGEWIGTFELGSTVILITEPAPGARHLVARDEKVKYGQPLLAHTC